MICHILSIIIMNYKQGLSQGCTVQRLSLICKLAHSTKHWLKLANRSKNRFYRLRQLVNTQADYTKDLKIIISKIQSPLKICAVITQEQENKMFPNLQSMIKLSQQLYKSLKKQLDGWDSRSTMIGQEMVKYSKFLLIYSDYFNNFKDNQNRIHMLLQTNEDVREIQKALSTNQKNIITIQGLIIKPVQRCLKYHLLLRDYHSKTDPTHPDYKYLQQAIQCYIKVNLKNNLAMQNKCKDETLQTLDAKFKNIIESNARYYVTQYECGCIDMECKLYVFSDLLILAKKVGGNQVEIQRIKLDQTSFVQAPSDGHFFMNQLFICGRRNCVHLTFLKGQEKAQAYKLLTNLIQTIYTNECSRKEIISMRLSVNTRQTMVEKRRSYTQLTSQITRTIQITVEGHEQRQLSPTKSAIFFIIKFKMSPPESSYQLSYVQLKDLLKIQTLLKSLYPKYVFVSIENRPNGLTESQCNSNQAKSLQFKSIFVQLLLNSIFRDQNLLKRADIFAYFLRISQTFWLLTKSSYRHCFCMVCMSEVPSTRISQYMDEKQKRRENMYEHKVSVVYCPYRTLSWQIQLNKLDKQQIQDSTMEERLFLVKCSLGRIDSALVNNSLNNQAKMKFKLYFCQMDNSNDDILIEIFKNDRVRTVLDFIMTILDMQMQDFGLVAYYGPKGAPIAKYVLDQDEILWDVLYSPKKKEEEGIFSVFTNIFTQQNYEVRVYLRKLYVLSAQLQLQAINNSQKNDKNIRLHRILQEMMYRLREEQLMLSQEDTYRIYARYYCYWNFFKLDLITQHQFQLGIAAFARSMPQRFRGKNLAVRIFKWIQETKKNNKYNSARAIAQDIILEISIKPGWSSYFFEADFLPTVYYPQGVRVKMGVDLRGLYVCERNKMNSIIQLTIQQLKGQYQSCVFQLTIYYQNTGPFVFVGKHVRRVRQFIDLYVEYKQHFL